MNLVLLALTLLGPVFADPYDNFTVYQMRPSESQNQVLKPLETDKNFDFWAPLNKIGEPVLVMVNPKVQSIFETYLKANDIDYKVHIEDVQKTIDAEATYHKSRSGLINGRISFDQYLTLDEIYTYLDKVVRENPEITSLEIIGRSHEFRLIPLLRIGAGGGNKPQIYVEGGIHAREWISPATILYLITELVKPENRHLIETVEWLIVPSTNPDGYQYTWTNQRLWRKTRAPGISCDGIDGNRNFAFHWMEAGASSNECSETYAGKYGFSEAETQAIRDSVLKENNIKLFLSVHSYGQYLLYSWGWTSTLPDNWQELDDLARKADDAIASVAGTRYRIGSSTNVLYSAAGNSPDWAKGEAGVDLSYTIELPGGGSYGFDLPPSRILAVAIETFEGFKAFGEYIGAKYA